MKSYRAFSPASQLLIAFLAPLFCGCGSGELPVAVLAAEPTRLDVGFSEVRPLHLFWEMRRPLEGQEGALRVFVHVLNGPGEVLRTFDHAFPQEWVPGRQFDYELDVYQSVLGPPLADGSYSISVGLHDGGGRRWPLSVAGEEVDDYEYSVAELTTSDRSAAPMFRFSEDWKPLEAGLDQQVLARRWLAAQGSIWVGEVVSEGAVWLTLQVPSMEPGVRRLVRDPGYQQNRVMIRSTCGGSEIELTGVGEHEIEVPVRPPREAGSTQEATQRECEIRFEPNFHLLTVGTTEQRSILLETLAWRAGRS